MFRFLRALPRLTSLLLALYTMLSLFSVSKGDANVSLWAAPAWAAPVANTPHQSVPPPLFLPYLERPLIGGCIDYFHVCNLTHSDPAEEVSHDWVAVEGAPGGGNVAFGSRDVVNPLSLTEIYTMTANGQADGLLAESARTLGLIWSPDGKYIAFYENDDLTNPSRLGKLKVLTVATKELRTVADLSLQGATLTWSPDSTTIGFIRLITTTGHTDLYTIHPDGSDLTQVTNTPVIKYNPLFSPDGSRIAFSGGANRDRLFMVGADGSYPTELATDRFDYVGDFDWSADGESLYLTGVDEFVAQGEGYDLFEIDIDSGIVTTLIEDEINQVSVERSPDGNKLLLVGTGEETINDHVTLKEDFYVLTLDGMQLTKFANVHPGNNATTNAQWLPNGKIISYEHAWDIYLMRVVE